MLGSIPARCQAGTGELTLSQTNKIARSQVNKSNPFLNKAKSDEGADVELW